MKLDEKRRVAMMQSNYWDQVIRRRVTRRRALVASGGFGLGAAALALSAARSGSPATTGRSPTKRLRLSQVAFIQAR